MKAAVSMQGNDAMVDGQGQKQDLEGMCIKIGEEKAAERGET